jgi:hypothetical protein
MVPVIRRVAAFVLLVLLAVSARAEADVRYTLKVEAQKSTEPLAVPPSPLMAVLGGVIASTLAPAGGVEVVVTAGDRGSRVEYRQAYAVVPAGGVALVRPDGAIVVIDPASKTYWKMPTPDFSMIKPDVNITRTGERVTMVGLDTERATLDIKVPLPLPPGTQLPPGIPSTLVITGETWLSERHKEYAKFVTAIGGVISLGLERLHAEGLPVRTVLRGEMFGDQQLVSTITSIGEVTVPADDYDVPAGFTEVAPPTSVPGLGRP